MKHNDLSTKPINFNDSLKSSGFSIAPIEKAVKQSGVPPAILGEKENPINSTV